jgi:carbon-monoxide dehydrogenase medium subunit
VTPFTYLEPKTLGEAFEMLSQHREDARIIAGGTALVNFMKTHLVEPKFVIGLRRIEELANVATGDGIKIGALTTLHTLERSDLIARFAPLLSEACHHVATPRIRMMATLGGAMAHADPALDTPPALLALDASVKIASLQNEREVPLREFFKGIFETALQPDEMITQISIPYQPERSGSAFLKFLPGSQDDYPTVSVAARITLNDEQIVDAKLALGAVGTTAFKADDAETHCG